MNFVPVDLAPWHPGPLVVVVLIAAMLVAFGIGALMSSKDPDGGVAGPVMMFFGFVGGTVAILTALSTGGWGWDGQQKVEALKSDGFTHVEYSVDGGYIASDNGEFVRIEFLTLDGQQGYAVITDGEGK